MKTKNSKFLIFPTVILMGSLTAPLAQAANQTWDGGDANSNWSTVGNWVGDVGVPGATSGTTNTDIATFNAAIANTWGNTFANPIVIDSPTRNLGGITFGTAAGNYFIGSTGGNSLLLTNGGTIQTLSTTAVETINAPIVIQGNGGSYNLINNSGAGSGSLTLGGGITGGASGNTTITLSGANTNSNTISGIIGDGSATSLAIIKNGAGNWRLSGTNTYTGGTTINGGTLTLGNFAQSALGRGAVTINSGAKLAVDANGAISNAINLNGGTIAGSNSFATNFSGSVSLAGSSTVDSSTTGNMAFTGNFSGTGSLTKVGANQGTNVTLSGTNTYTGTTTVSQGILQFKNSIYGNDTTQWTPANIRVSSGATFAMNVGGSSDFTVAQASTMLANLSTGISTNGLVAGSTFGLDTSNAPGPITFSGTIANSTGVGGGAVGITKLGSPTSTLALTGANTYTGKTTIYGTLIVTSLNSVNGGSPLLASSSLGAPTTVANGTITFGDSGGGGGVGALVYGGTGETTDRILNLGAQAGTITLDQRGSGLLKFSSGLTINSNGTKVINLQGSTTGTGEISGAIPNVGALNLTKNGSGTWNLSGVNAYAGTTTINGGLLRITGSIAGGAVTVATGGALGGTGTVGGTVTVGLGTAISPSGAIRLTDGVIGDLTLGSSLTFSGTTAIPNNLSFDLGAGVATTDRITTVGAHNAATAGSVIVSLNQLAGGSVTPGIGKILIQGGAASTFAGYTLATTRSGGNIYSNLTGSGNNLVVDIATAAAGSAGAFWAGSSNLWSAAANWNTDATSNTTLGSIPGVGTNVTFATTTPVAGNLTTNTVDADFEINSLSFNSATGGVTVGGTKTLTIDATNANGNTAGNGITSGNTSGTNTISTKIGLGGSQTWKTSGGTLAVNGSITDFGAGHALTKDGPGILSLGGSNTYSGGTVVIAGTLSSSATSSISSAFGTGPITLGNGTTLQSTAGVATTFNNALILPSGTATIAALAATGQDVTVGGLVSGAGGLIITSDLTGRKVTLASANTFTGGVLLTGGATNPRLVINNAASLGTGTLRSELTGTSGGLENGTTDLSGGSGVPNAIDLGTGANLNVGNNSSVNMKLAGTISGAGSLTKLGNGIVILTGSNTYSGGTTVTLGGLTFLNTAAKPTTGITTVASAAILGLGVGGTGFFSSTDVDSLFLDTLTNVSRNASSIVGIDTTAGDFTYATSNIASTLGVAKLGNNTLTVSGNSAYSGVTTVAAGTLKLGAAGAGGATPLGTAAGGTVVNSGAALDLNGFTLSTAEALSLNGTGPGNSGALVNTGTTAATYTGSLALLNTAASGNSIVATNGDIILSNTGTISNTGAPLTLGGNLTATTGSSIATVIATGNGTLTKVGGSTWTVSGVNTFTGATNINSGTLKLGAAGNSTSGPLGTVAAGTAVASGGTLDLNGFTLGTAEALTLNGVGFNNNGALANSSATAATYSGAVTLNGASTITSNSGNLLLSGAGTITGAGFGLTLDGTATGSSIPRVIATTTGALTKNGTGAWTLSAANTFTGVTTVNGGALVLNNATALPGGIGVAGGTSALTFNGGVVGLGNGDFSRSLTAAGSATGVNFTGPGGWAAYNADRTVNLGGASTTVTWATANTGFNSQTLILSSSTATHLVDVQNPLDLGAAPRTVRVDNGSAAVDARLSGILSGTGGGLTKAGTGTLEFTGTNTYSGATSVTAGTLNVNGANIGTGPVSVALGATLGGTGSIAGTINVTGVLSPGASVESLSSGALTMNSGSTFIYEATNNTATGADLMVVNGLLSLTGVTLDLSAANLGLNTWLPGDTLTLISYTGAGITSGFNGYTDDTSYTFGTNQWFLNYNDTVKGLNYAGEAAALGSGSFVTFTLIPEPSVAMLVGGLGLITLLRRRRG